MTWVRFPADPGGSRSHGVEPPAETSTSLRCGGSGWESNPPPAVRGPLVLKTKEATRLQSLPQPDLQHRTGAVSRARLAECRETGGIRGPVLALSSQAPGL